MRQLLPSVLEVDDPAALLGDDDRPVPADRPWVMANMVVSLDGAVAVDGRSGGLGGEPDREMFAAVRSLPDVVLVGAGTARTEQYRRPAPGPAAGLRTARGQAPAPRLAVVSASCRVPDDQPFLTGDGPDPLVFHPASVDPSGLPAGTEARAAGGTEVDLHDVLAQLRADGARSVLCEGGPRLLGSLHVADLVDELFVTVSPQLVGGDAVGFLGGGEPVVRNLVLHRLVEDRSVLLTTWRRAR